MSVTEESFQPSWFENIDFEYDEFRAERDEALIRFFVQLLWDLEEEEDLLKAVDNEYLD